MQKYFILWVSVLLLGGCAMHSYGPAEVRIVTFKTPKFRFSDMGYLRYGTDAVELDLYSGGQPVRRFEIGERICVDEGCMERSDFNREYLSAGYPDDLLLHIVRGSVIFEGEGRRLTADGFEQQIQNRMYDLEYRVGSDGILFRDHDNHILIRIRKP